MDTELLTKRTVSESIFTRHAAIIESLIAVKSTSTRIIKRHLNEFNAQWNALQEAHDIYVITCLIDSSYSTENATRINLYSATFIRMEAACDKFIHEGQPVKGTASSSNSIKLERVKFRTFDGDIRQYPKFKSEFVKFVQPLCSPDQLTLVLKSYLCDSVRCLLNNTDHDIDAMWKRLDEKYGAIHKQIDCIMNDIKNLPRCDDGINTLKMIETVETAYSDLSCINAVDELQNSTIISLIEESMPTVMFKEWVKLAVSEDSSKNKFQKLLSFLQEWRHMIEYQDADIRKSPSPVSPISVCLASTHSHRCLIHTNEEHPVWRCRVFRAMSPAERRNVVNSRNACTLCLDIGHGSADCLKTFKCTVPGCNASHNFLLHDSYDATR